MYKLTEKESQNLGWECDRRYHACVLQKSKLQWKISIYISGFPKVFISHITIAESYKTLMPKNGKYRHTRYFSVYLHYNKFTGYTIDNPTGSQQVPQKVKDEINKLFLNLLK